MEAPPLDDSILMGLYILQQGCLRHVNLQAARLLGYDDPTELIGRPIRSLIPTEDLGQFRVKANIQGEAGDCPAGHAFRMIKKNGDTVKVSMKGDNTHYEGKPANIGCIVDMTAIVRLEKALEKYRAMLNQVDDAIAEMDLKGNIIFSNTSPCRKWDTLGDKNKTLNFRTYVDEDYLDAFIQAYKKIYDTGNPNKHIVYKVKLADGQRLTVEDAVNLIQNDEGDITGFRILSRNITDRKKAEKKLARQRTQLQAIFRSVNDAIITVDPDMKITETNRAAQTICGVNPESSSGAPITRCLSVCKRTCLQLLRQTIENKTGVREHQVVCGHQDNHQQCVNISSSPLLDHQGNFIGAALVIRDMTQLKKMEAQLHQQHQYKNITAKSKTMTDILGIVKKLTRLDTTVLITGESGTGKELIAKALHYNGPRTDQPFISVNCSALNENLLESELFGHSKGAFTGAIHEKKGRFEAADGGTILLDEIGDISPLIQLKLLRVLQEKEFERVGEAVPRKVDVRVIASTNKDLKSKIEKGEFREDLYYRLNVLQIPLPPLRARTEDIPLLTDYFRKIFNQRLNKNIKSISKEAMRCLESYGWPGNVRELEHVVERACILCRGSEILTEHLPMEMNKGLSSEDQTHHLLLGRRPQNAQDIVDILKQNQWNRTKTAQMLGISRQTLYRKMKEHGISGKMN